jgi:hypothetical protein
MKFFPNPYTYESIVHDYVESIDPRSDFSQRHAYAVRRIMDAYVADTTMIPLEDVEPLLFIEHRGELTVPNWRNTSSTMQGAIRLLLQDTNERLYEDCD